MKKIAIIFVVTLASLILGVGFLFFIWSLAYCVWTGCPSH
jgi:hypothetical protein